MASNTKIMACKCHSQAQDEFHGKGQRVHNYAIGSSKSGASSKRGWRCTSCLDMKPCSDSDK